MIKFWNWWILKENEKNRKILYNEFFNIYMPKSNNQLLQHKAKTIYIVGIIINKEDNNVGGKENRMNLVLVKILHKLRKYREI